MLCLDSSGLLVSLDCTFWTSRLWLCRAGERIGKLIRNAEKAKTPVMCVVGEKEASASQLSVRLYGEDGDRGVMALSDVITRIQDASKMRISF